MTDKMKFFWIILMVCGCLSLTGCGIGTSATLMEESSEEEVEKKVIDYIKKNYGDTVTAEMISKEELEVATSSLDGPAGFKQIKGGYKYCFNVTPAQYPDFKAEVKYNDGYTLKKSGKITEYPSSITTEYETAKTYYELGKKMASLIQEYDEDAYVYKTAKNLGQYLIAIKQDDFETICRIHETIRDFMNSCREENEKLHITTGVFYAAYSGIDFTKIENMQFGGFGETADRTILEGFGLEDSDKFATCKADSIEEFKAFFESKGNLEEYWNLPKESKKTPTYHFMRRNYEEYGDIVFYEKIDSGYDTGISWNAWGNEHMNK